MLMGCCLFSISLSYDRHICFWMCWCLDLVTHVQPSGNWFCCSSSFGHSQLLKRRIYCICAVNVLAFVWEHVCVSFPCVYSSLASKTSPAFILSFPWTSIHHVMSIDQLVCFHRSFWPWSLKLMHLFSHEDGICEIAVWMAKIEVFSLVYWLQMMPYVANWLSTLSYVCEYMIFWVRAYFK